MCKIGIVGFLLVALVLLSGCVPATTPPPVSPPAVAPPQEPAPEKEAPEPSQEELWSWEELSMQDIRNQVTILEWPTEAHIGENITVRIKTGSEEFWAWLEQEVINRKEYDSIWLDPYYSLYLMPARGLIPCAVIGLAEPDENHEVWWYGPIPTSAEGEPIEPGTWKLIVEIGDPLGSVDTIVERNIIIKR
jgi:hypothetical protein